MNRCLRTCVALTLLTLTTPHIARAQATAPGATEPPAERPAERLTPLTQIALRKGRRVVRELRLVEFDMPNVLAATRQREPEGGEDLFIVYEISLFNQCVFTRAPSTSAERREAREACREARGIETKLAHVHVAPTPAGRTEDIGGAIEVVARQALGTRSARPEAIQTETYFQSMGRVDTVPGSELRVWIAMTQCEFEEMNESRGEDIRSSWFVQEERLLRVYSVDLEVDAEVSLGTGEGSFERRGEYAGPDVTAPQVRADPRTHALTVRAGGEAFVLTYDAEHDRFEAP